MHFNSKYFYIYTDGTSIYVSTDRNILCGCDLKSTVDETIKEIINDSKGYMMVEEEIQDIKSILLRYWQQIQEEIVESVHEH